MNAGLNFLFYNVCSGLSILSDNYFKILIIIKLMIHNGLTMSLTLAVSHYTATVTLTDSVYAHTHTHL